MQFSLIIPVYNAEGFIARTLESVYRQTDPPEEVIIVDDGSTDQSVRIIELWVEKHGWGKRVRLILQDNQGAAGARNTGIRAARGDIVSFLDSDDKLRSTHFQHARTFFQHYPHFNWYASKAISHDGSKIEHLTPPRFFLTPLKGTKEKFYTTDYFISCLFHRYFVHTNVVFFKRQVLMEHSLMDPTLSIGEDQDLFFRFALKHPQMGISRRTTACYQRFQNKDSLMNSISRKENGENKIRCLNKWLHLIEKEQIPFPINLKIYIYIASWRFQSSRLDQMISRKTLAYYSFAAKIHWMISKLQYLKQYLFKK